MCLEDPWFESRLDKSYGLICFALSQVSFRGEPIFVISWLTHKSRNFPPTNFMIGHVRCIYNVERTR